MGTPADTTPVTKWVIDFKEDETRVFKIGHQCKSETFFPLAKRFGDDGTILFDLAGLKDRDGDLTETANQFINKKLFNVVENMVILIPFTVESLSVARGAVLNEQLEILLNSFKHSPKKMVKSIIPIVTKVNPEDKELNI